MYLMGNSVANHIRLRQHDDVAVEQGVAADGACAPLLNAIPLDRQP